MTAAMPAPPLASSALCPRHQKVATSPCSRCGTFRCEECGDSSLCGACKERLTEAPFFPTSLGKMAVLHVCTFGMYALFWAYQQWKRVKASGVDVWPAPRAVFFGFTAFDLFRRIASRMSDAGLTVGFNPSVLGGLVLLCNITFRLPDPFWLLGLLQIVPLLLVQRNINALNARVAPAAERNERFTAGSIVIIVLGGLMWMLVLAGLFLPEDGASAAS